MRVVAAGAVAALLLVIVGPSPAGAASAKDKKGRQQQIGRQITSLRGQVEEASAEEAALLDQIDASRTKLADLNATVADLNTRVTAAQTALDDAQVRLTTADGALTAAQSQLTALTSRLAAARDELRRRAVDAYVNQDKDQLTDIYLGLRSPAQVDAAMGYATVIIADQQRAVDDYDRLRDQASDARRAVAAARDDAVRERDAVAGQRAAVVAVRDQQEAARQQAAAETDHENGLLDQVRSHKAEFEAQINSLQAESDSITAFLHSLQGDAGIVVSGRGVLSIPIPGAPVTSGFGPRVHPIFGTVRMHTGIDFGAGTGTPIRAAADGTVVSAGAFGGYGNATIIDHGNGMATLYGHQSRLLVTQGQHVVRGQVIGLVGSTGFATGPHLHFEVRISGTPVNPVSYL